jgi:hypothetical protein
MNKHLKAVLFGFSLWLIPFAVSILIFPLRTTQRSLFESIMPVVIAVWTVFFSMLYLTRIEGNFLKEGIFIGIFWLLISIILDLIVFLGPLKMPLQDYLSDIAVTYLIIPTIAIGYGYQMAHPRAAWPDRPGSDK